MKHSFSVRCSCSLMLYNRLTLQVIWGRVAYVSSGVLPLLTDLWKLNLPNKYEILIAKKTLKWPNTIDKSIPYSYTNPFLRFSLVLRERRYFSGGDSQQEESHATFKLVVRAYLYLQRIKVPTLLDCSKANLSVKVAMLIAGIYETKVLYLNTLLLLTLDYESVAFCHNINVGKVQQNVFRYHDISYLHKLIHFTIVWYVVGSLFLKGVWNVLL